MAVTYWLNPPTLADAHIEVGDEVELADGRVLTMRSKADLQWLPQYRAEGVRLARYAAWIHQAEKVRAEIKNISNVRTVPRHTRAHHWPITG